MSLFAQPEPVALTAAAVAVLNVAALVLHLDGQLVIALNATLAPIVALFVRHRVTPV